MHGRSEGGKGKLVAEGMLTPTYRASPATRAFVTAQSRLSGYRRAHELIASPRSLQRLATHTLNFQQR